MRAYPFRAQYDECGSTDRVTDQDGESEVKRLEVKRLHECG